MMHDRVAGWQAVERVDVGVRLFRSPALVTMSRWVSPTGKEATIVSSRSLWRGAEPLPATVSCPTVAKDAHLRFGRYVVDPQLHWDDRDGRHLVVMPSLGLQVSVPVPDDGFAKYLARFDRRPCRAHIESLSDRERTPTWRSSGADGWDIESVRGTHPALVTRWGVPATMAPVTRVAPTPPLSRTPGPRWVVDPSNARQSASVGPPARVDEGRGRPHTADAVRT